MKTSGIIESMGVLLKEETLQTVEHYVLQNTMVLESMEPFPGYHGQNMPGSSIPESLFLITDKTYPIEYIFRISQSLCAYHHVHFDACPAEIFIQNTNFPGIRIKGMSNYSLISDIQGCYMDKGIHFMKKKITNAPGLIRLTKVFSVEKMAEEVYRDIDDAFTYYLPVPYHFDWNLFKKVTLNVKNNVENSNFDCASGFIYLKAIMEFVRIFAHNPDIARLQTIRDKYLEEIRRIQDDTL